MSVRSKSVIRSLFLAASGSAIALAAPVQSAIPIGNISVYSADVIYLTNRTQAPGITEPYLFQFRQLEDARLDNLATLPSVDPADEDDSEDEEDEEETLVLAGNDVGNVPNTKLLEDGPVDNAQGAGPVCEESPGLECGTGSNTNNIAGIADRKWFGR